jgi:phage recombination protein Bet
MNMPAVVSQRGISTEVWSALKNSIFPGASDESVVMAIDYCTARQLDVMLKPVHLVPMYIKDKQNGDKGAMRDVVMPGIGLYRIQADRAGNYAGMSAPKFGPDIADKLQGVDITYPEWCEITVSKIVGDRLVEFTAREYWIENYATAGRDTKAPNAMWLKRPRGQLVKCTEAQALRKGWPELGAQPTAEEMEGKEIDITPKASVVEPIRPALTLYSDEDFKKNFAAWEKLIASGKKSADVIIAMVSSKGQLSENQINAIKSIEDNINDQAEAAQ